MMRRRFSISALVGSGFLAACLLGSAPSLAQEAGAGLVQRLQALEEEVRRLRPLEEKVAALEERRFESGRLEIHMDQIPGLMGTSPCAAGVFRGTNDGRVTFSKPFARAPKVVVGLSGMDIGPLNMRLEEDILRGMRARLNIRVHDVDQYGFNYTFVTWCETFVIYAQGGWFAFLEDEAPQAE